MKTTSRQWKLVLYDIFILAIVDLLLLVLYRGNENLSASAVLVQATISFFCIFITRFTANVYHQIWRYGGVQCYIRLIFADGFAFLINLMFEMILPVFIKFERITFTRLLAISSINLLGALAMRLFYRYLYKCIDNSTRYGRFLNVILYFFAGSKIEDEIQDINKIKIAIIGAGRIGVTLAEDLRANKYASYVPCCFIDVKDEKNW